MIENVVASIVCSEHQRMKRANNAGKAMCVDFRLRNNHHGEWQEDYYPKLRIIIWSPSNYTKVLIQESDPHHFGDGPIIKVSDHDSCWRDGVERVIQHYAKAIGGIDSLMHWFEVVPADREAWTMEHGRMKDARFLPCINGLPEPKQRPPSIYGREA